MASDPFRDSLPDDAENFDVFCERCQCVHKYYTFTKQDYDRVVSEGAQQLADAIDAGMVEKLLRGELK